MHACFSQIITYHNGLEGIDISNSTSGDDLWDKYLGHDADHSEHPLEVKFEGPSNAVVIGSLCAVGAVIVLVVVVVVVSIIIHDYDMYTGMQGRLP